MDLIDQLRNLASKIEKVREKILTEEATKQAFVLPLISMLGYEVWDPTEVVPEYIADVGIKKGEKIDYAIFKDGEPIILIECKHCEQNLERITATQLYRYFSVTKARVAVLTNGIVYKFYTDVDEPNKLDTKPFMVFDMLDFQENQVSQLKKLSKGAYDLSTMLSTAVELKYTQEIKRLIGEQFNEPSDEMIRFFTKAVYQGPVTQAVKDQFTDIVKRAMGQFLNDRIASRLKTAFHPETLTEEKAIDEIVAESAAAGTEVVTTEEEREGFMIVRAILRAVVDVSRVFARDTKSYFGILLDDNNRKQICRLYFNYSTKYLSIIDTTATTDAGRKAEVKFPLSSLDDIYQYSEQIKAAALQYDVAVTPGNATAVSS